MVEHEGEPYIFDLSGGRPCLDFANTLSDRPTPRPVERLAGYVDLVSWGRQTGLLADQDAGRLLEAAHRRPADASAVRHRAVALREAIYRIFRAIAEATSLDDADLAILNDALATALARAVVVPTAGRFDWGWVDDGEPALDRVLWPVARDAAELLTSDELPQVRVCPAHDCAWLFEDRSRNGSRRWCDMKVCGNRAKARRHQARRRVHE